ARGGYAAAGAFMQRAAQLTPDASDRSRRALDAAHALHEAGASASATDLLATAETGPLNALQHARVELLRAQIAFHLTRRPEVPRMLMDAASTLAPLDAALSRETCLHAMDAAVINGGPETRVIADAVLATSTSGGPARPVDGLLDGLAVATVHGFAAGVPRLRRVLETLREDARAGVVRDDRSQPWLWLAGRIAVGILDDELAHELAEADVRSARASGALAALPDALKFHANVLILSGQLTRARELVAEATALTESTGGVPTRHAETILAGWRGDRAVVTELHELTLQDASYPAEGVEVAMAEYAKAVLHNALGDYSIAQEAATTASASAELAVSTVGLPELIEAAARAGDEEATADALDRLSSRARACATPWAWGIEARSRALTTAGPAAEGHHREAIMHLEASRMGGETARAHLVFGEWLRREGRRQEARDELRTAYELLSGIGANAFAARAARELRATGEHPRKRSAQPTDVLTAQELHIARIVASGATSREVGAQLFLSPRTIEAHLRNIFRKLGITSRRQLKEFRLP
ncbi:LuxR C-terminal-related transcriptional regulator, partial [Microbacterium sp.]|uniref:LuxR C-terminal-related transcriptional regulator n=1 Tax=Microbacterium sp. TaxID=51671 RepID=UPI003C791C8F